MGGEVSKQLHMACHRGELELVADLLDQGVESVEDVEPDFGRTALHFASGSKSRIALQVVELLFQKGADLNHVDARGWVPLHYACLHSNKDVVEFLLAKGAVAEIRGKEGLAPWDVLEGAPECLSAVEASAARVSHETFSLKFAEAKIEYNPGESLVIEWAVVTKTPTSPPKGGSGEGGTSNAASPADDYIQLYYMGDNSWNLTRRIGSYRNIPVGNKEGRVSFDTSFFPAGRIRAAYVDGNTQNVRAYSPACRVIGGPDAEEGEKQLEGKNAEKSDDLSWTDWLLLREPPDETERLFQKASDPPWYKEGDKDLPVDLRKRIDDEMRRVVAKAVETRELKPFCLKKGIESVSEEDMTGCAAAMLSDPNVDRLRYMCVPGRVKEGVFWTNYINVMRDTRAGFQVEVDKWTIEFLMKEKAKASGSGGQEDHVGASGDIAAEAAQGSAANEEELKEPLRLSSPPQMDVKIVYPQNNE